jgi:hypothetical protein
LYKLNFIYLLYALISENKTFFEYSARMSIVRTLILQQFLVEKRIYKVPSKYSAQAIFDHNFIWKKCTLHYIKYGNLSL